MPIRINSQVVYGTFKARQRKFKVGEDGIKVTPYNKPLKKGKKK